MAGTSALYGWKTGTYQKPLSPLEVRYATPVTCSALESNRLNVTSNRIQPARCHSVPADHRRSGVVDHEAADVAAVEHVPVALIDVVQAVPGGDQLVEPELPRPVQLEQPRDRLERVAAAEQRAVDPLLEQGELEPR